jgi:hypothetical protein
MLKTEENLDKMAIHFGTDKSSLRHNYCNHYENHLHEWRNKKFNLLEIGVLNGSSLKLWKSYFPHAEITGIDINPECKKYEEEKISVRIGDQTDTAFLASIVKEKKYDIIIDDGSHIWDHLVKSFEFLFPHLNENGLYCMEDLLDCYDPSHAGIAGLNAINFLKNTIDNVNLHGLVFRDDRSIPVRAASFKEKQLKKNKKLDYRNFIQSLHFYCGLCIIKKH